MNSNAIVVYVVEIGLAGKPGDLEEGKFYTQSDTDSQPVTSQPLRIIFSLV